MVRISRPCYDKPHRCPGHAGGGIHYAKDHRCEDGRIHALGRGEWDHPAKFWWLPGRCNECRVVTFPWFTRRLDPTWWRSEWRTLRLRVENWLYWKGWRV